MDTSSTKSQVVYDYLVVVMLSSSAVARIGEEFIEVSAYTLQDAMIQALMEVSARNSTAERGVRCDVGWAGPSVPWLRARAEAAVAAFWLARQAVSGQSA